jgi:hypothetical protein
MDSIEDIEEASETKDSSPKKSEDKVQEVDSSPTIDEQIDEQVAVEYV